MTHSKKSELQHLLIHPEVVSWRALMEAFSFIFTQLEKGLMSEGCSVSRFQILFYLYFSGEHQAVELAKKLLVTRGNITMFLRRMENDGLIKPVIPKGKKCPVYTLTRKGILQFEKIFPPHVKRIRQLSPVLNAKTLQILRDVCNSSNSSEGKLD